jgi:site-specific recombinase XerD
MTPPFSALLQRFFTERLAQQRHASPHTIAAYRDTFRLVLQFAADRLHRAPSALTMDDLSPAFIGEFLEHLGRDRHNSSRTCNARLAALHAFAQFVALHEPAHALTCQRLLAMPSRRFERKTIAFLTPAEAAALLAAPHLSTWIGLRDRVLILVALQTGLRVSELTRLRRSDVILGPGAHLRCMGKGRKERCTPLRREVAAALDAWFRRHPGGPSDPVFPSTRGAPLSRDAVERLVARHAQAAADQCASLRKKRVTPHVRRHTTAMDLLTHGIDRAVIALWLGHESVETTQMYLHADLRLKEEALARTSPLPSARARFRPRDELLAFLEGL